MKNTPVNVGDTVQYTEVKDEGDAEARMIVLEVDAARDWALVEDVCDMPIRPTRTVRLSEVIRAS